MGELAVEPRDQPAHLDALGERAAQERRLRVGFLQVLAHHPGIRDDEAVLLNEGGHRVGRLHPKVLGPPFPDLLDAHLKRQLLLGQREAHLARERREGEMVEKAHGGGLWHRAATRSTGITDYYWPSGGQPVYLT